MPSNALACATMGSLGPELRKKITLRKTSDGAWGSLVRHRQVQPSSQLIRVDARIEVDKSGDLVGVPAANGAEFLARDGMPG